MHTGTHAHAHTDAHTNDMQTHTDAHTHTCAHTQMPTEARSLTHTLGGQIFSDVEQQTKETCVDCIH